MGGQSLLSAFQGASRIFGTYTFRKVCHEFLISRSRVLEILQSKVSNQLLRTKTSFSLSCLDIVFNFECCWKHKSFSLSCLDIVFNFECCWKHKSGSIKVKEQPA